MFLIFSPLAEGIRYTLLQVRNLDNKTGMQPARSVLYRFCMSLYMCCIGVYRCYIGVYIWCIVFYMLYKLLHVYIVLYMFYMRFYMFYIGYRRRLKVYVATLVFCVMNMCCLLLSA